MKVVYIGHGSSGWTSATTLRAWDRNAEITVIDKKNYDAYHPCAMPYAIGGLWEDESPLIESMNYQMMKINFLRRHEALKIDRQNKKVNVKNLETDHHQLIDTSVNVSDALERLQSHRDTMKKLGIDWIEIDTKSSYLNILHKYFYMKKQRRR